MNNAWLSPEGELHEVKPWGHEAWAVEVRGESFDSLHRQGWRRLSQGYFDPLTCTQAQLDTIYQWHQDNDKEFVPSDYGVV